MADQPVPVNPNVTPEQAEAMKHYQPAGDGRPVKAGDLDEQHIGCYILLPLDPGGEDRIGWQDLSAIVRNGDEVLIYTLQDFTEPHHFTQGDTVTIDGQGDRA